MSQNSKTYYYFIVQCNVCTVVCAVVCSINAVKMQVQYLPLKCSVVEVKVP